MCIPLNFIVLLPRYAGYALNCIKDTKNISRKNKSN